MNGIIFYTEKGYPCCTSRFFSFKKDWKNHVDCCLKFGYSIMEKVWKKFVVKRWRILLDNKEEVQKYFKWNEKRVERERIKRSEGRKTKSYVNDGKLFIIIFLSYLTCFVWILAV